MVDAYEMEVNHNKDIELLRDEFVANLDINHIIYSLTLNGKSVGYIVLKKEDNNYLLQTIFVRKEERRKGYGTMLFKHAEKLANEEKLNLLINVQPSNTACTELLKKNGYVNIEYIQISKTK